MLVDAHTHLTEPEEIILKRLKQAGIDKAVVCSSGLARGEHIYSLQDAKTTFNRIAEAQNGMGQELTLQDINTKLAQVVANHCQKLIGFGKIDLFQSEILMEAQKILDLGLKGIGEVVGIHGNTKLLEPLFQFSHEQNGFPVFIHCDYPVDATDLKAVFELAKRFNRAKIIVGHLGGDYWIEAIEVALNCPNIYLDTSEVVNAAALQVAVRELPDKVVFGSDFPWDSPEAMLKRFDHLDIDSGAKKKVLGLNMLEALGI